MTTSKADEGKALILQSYQKLLEQWGTMWIYNSAELSKHFRLFAVDTIGGPGRSVPDARYDRSFDQARWIDKSCRTSA